MTPPSPVFRDISRFFKHRREVDLSLEKQAFQANNRRFAKVLRNDFQCCTIGRSVTTPKPDFSVSCIPSGADLVQLTPALTPDRLKPVENRPLPPNGGNRGCHQLRQVLTQGDAVADSTKGLKSRKPKTPDKPYSTFPLFAHQTGRWEKKVRQKMRFYGRWGRQQQGHCRGALLASPGFRL